MAQSLPTARQGLGEPQQKGARVLAPRINPPHAQKTLQSGLNSPDRLLGVAQHFMTAVSWYRRAADQGNTAAQLNLGIMYDNGWGVAQNYVIAHMWFSLAAAMGDRDAARSQDVAAAKMTPAQLAEAQRLAREWEPK